jgi:hypothetical protein
MVFGCLRFEATEARPGSLAFGTWKNSRLLKASVNGDGGDEGT